jgi:mRNA interferase RelE/StbE
MTSRPSVWRKDIKPEATKAIRRVPADLRDRLVAAIEALPDGEVKKLQGSDEYRARVGEWRIRFAVDRGQRVITILAVTPRGQAYKRH